MEASQRRQTDTVDDSAILENKGNRRKNRLGDRCVSGGNIWTREIEFFGNLLVGLYNVNDPIPSKW